MCLRLDDAGRAAAQRHIAAELHRQATGGALQSISDGIPGTAEASEPEPLDRNAIFNALVRENRSPLRGRSLKGNH